MRELSLCGADKPCSLGTTLKIQLPHNYNSSNNMNATKMNGPGMASVNDPSATCTNIIIEKNFYFCFFLFIEGLRPPPPPPKKKKVRFH